jgi:hypothetical protein
MYLKSLVKKMRNYFWASPIVWVILLVGCGAGSVLDPFVPTRIIAFGDAYMDVNKAGVVYPYTINDAASVQQLTLIERFAANYNFGSVTFADAAGNTDISAPGAYSYGQGYALVNGSGPITLLDNTSITTGASVTAQVNAFLTKYPGGFGGSDLVVINGGTADILATAGVSTTAAKANVKTAAKALASLVELVISKGATHVVVFGAPNLSRTPYAYAQTATARSILQALSLYDNNTDITHDGSSSNCEDFQCVLTLSLQDHFGSISQNPVLTIDISAQSSVITGTTTTGSVSTFASAVDPLYGVALLYPGDPVFADVSNHNYYCASAYISSGSTCTAVHSLDYLTYAYADQINFAPSVNRMLADYIIGCLSLASWR